MSKHHILRILIKPKIYGKMHARIMPIVLEEWPLALILTSAGAAAAGAPIIIGASVIFSVL